MKKSIAILGLFLMMISLTSFTTPNEIGGRSEEPRLSVQTETLSIGGRSEEPRLSIQTEILSIGGRSEEPR